MTNITKPTDLSDFARLLSKAAAERDNKIKAENEKKIEEITPLLSNLFATVAKAKAIVLEEPDVQISSIVEKIETAVESAIPDIKTAPVEVTTKTQENNLVAMFKRLQNDFQTLKHYVESKQTATTMITSGGGEVRITNMDDIIKTKPLDGQTLVWNTPLNKFIYITPSIGSDEEVPYAKRVDFVTDNFLYKGEAVVGSSESSSVWRIRQITIGSDSDVTEIWANGSSEYNCSWTDRTTYSYS